MLGFFCHHGKHRSVAIASMVHRCLQDAGWLVDIRHLGGYRTMDCTCSLGPEGTFCAAVWRHLSQRSNGWEWCKTIFGQHLEAQAQAMARFKPQLMEAMGQAGLRLDAPYQLLQ